jgi:hypothetical protein
MISLLSNLCPLIIVRYSATDGDIFNRLVKSASRATQSEIATKDNLINDIEINRPGSSLFMASGSSVKLWDIRMYVQDSIVLSLSFLFIVCLFLPLLR